MSKLANLRQAVRNLVYEFGSTNNWIVGLTVNVAGMLVGLGVWYAGHGWVAFLGAAWAILHMLAIGKWAVMDL